MVVNSYFLRVLFVILALSLDYNTTSLEPVHLKNLISLI